MAKGYSITRKITVNEFEDMYYNKNMSIREITHAKQITFCGHLAPMNLAIWAYQHNFKLREYNDNELAEQYRLYVGVHQEAKKLRFGTNFQLHDDAVQKISNKCKICDSTDIMKLEIHHKNNDGNIERQYLKDTMFYKAIINGERKTDDLVILCETCHKRLTHSKKQIEA